MNVRSATAPENNLRDASRRKLVWWAVFIGCLIALEYVANLASSASQRASQDVLYKYSTAIADAVVYVIWLGIILVIAGRQKELFALRRPRSWPRGLGLAVLTLVVSYAAIRLIDPFLHAGREQGLVPAHWEPNHTGAFVANWVVVGGVAPVVEEMTFRGLGYSLIAARWGSTAAIVAVGVLFAERTACSRRSRSSPRWVVPSRGCARAPTASTSGSSPTRPSTASRSQP